MSTHAQIGIENDDGTIESIYCHFDGYQEGVGNTLAQHYSDEDKIRSLMALGDISYLAPELGQEHDFDNPIDGWTVAYGRDRGEDDTGSSISTSIQDYTSLGEDFQYLFTKDKKWILVANWGKLIKLALNSKR